MLRLLLFPAVSAFHAALEAGVATLARWQGALIILLPGLAWLWLPHFSVLGCSDARYPQDTSSAPRIRAVYAGRYRLSAAGWTPRTPVRPRPHRARVVIADSVARYGELAVGSLPDGEGNKLWFHLSVDAARRTHPDPFAGCLVFSPPRRYLCAKPPTLTVGRS